MISERINIFCFSRSFNFLLWFISILFLFLCGQEFTNIVPSVLIRWSIGISSIWISSVWISIRIRSNWAGAIITSITSWTANYRCSIRISSCASIRI